MNADRTRGARASGPLVPDGVAAVPVALGQRSYDVLIGAGLLARAADLIDSRLGAAKCVIVTDENVAERHLAPLEAALQGLGRHAGTQILAAGGDDQELRRAGEPVRAHPGNRPRARRAGDCAGRRRHRRPRRLCSEHRAPRCRLRPDPHDAAGAGRFLGRRQDRHQHAARQEPRRHLPSAEPRAGRHRPAGDAAARANFAPATSRPPSTACSAMPSSSAGSSRTTGRSSRRTQRRWPSSSAPASRARPRSSPATRPKPATACCSTSATPSATRWRPGPATRNACCTAKRSPSASASPSSFARSWD